MTPPTYACGVGPVITGPASGWTPLPHREPPGQFSWVRADRGNDVVCVASNPQRVHGSSLPATAFL